MNPDVKFKTGMRYLIAGWILIIMPLYAASESDGLELEGIHIESLIAQSVGMERRFQNQGLFFEDRDLEEYLDEILESLATPEESRQFMLKARVLRGGAVNAFASPHGTIFVCTGLLARLTSEAQAAALLAHELAHVVSFHAPKTLVVLKAGARSNARARKMSAPPLGDWAAGGSAGGAALLAAVKGYGRTLEREADSAGLVRMAAAGYPHGEFQSLFAMLGEYAAAEKIKEPYFFSSHPRIAERLENYKLLAGTLGLADDVDCYEAGINKEGSPQINVDKTESQVSGISADIDKSENQASGDDFNIDKNRSQLSDININVDKIRSQVSDISVYIDKSKRQANGVRKGNCKEDDIGRGYFNIKVRNAVLYEAAVNLAAGRYEAVESQLGRLLSVDSGDAAALVMRGDMERMLSPRGTAAMAWYERALKSGPDNPAALRAAGFAYHSTGDFENARAHLRKYCTLAPDAADIKMAKEVLRQCGE